MNINVDKTRWTRVTFEDVIENVAVRVDDPRSAGVERYVGLEHLNADTLTVQRWSSPDQVQAQKLRFEQGDVIFGRRRAYQRKVSRADFAGICSAHALVLRAKPGLCDPDFLPVFLASNYFLDRAISISVGSLSPTVNWRDLRVQKFGFPCLDQQTQIASLFWSLEAHSSATATSQRAASAAYEAWITSHLAPVPTRPLGDLVALQHGRPVPSDLYGSEGVPLLRPGDMRPNGSTAWTSSSVRIPEEFAQRFPSAALSAGDLVINMTAQSLEDRFLGRVCRLHDRAFLNQRIGRLTPLVPMNVDYLYAALRTPAFTSWVAQRSEGSKIKHMHWRHIEAYPLPWPNLDTQQVVARTQAQWERASALLVQEVEHVASARRALDAAIFGSCT